MHNRSPRQIGYFVALVSALSIVFLVWLDIVTGPDVHIGLYYPVPVLFTAWYSGRRLGIVLALLCIVAWLFRDLHHGILYANLTYAYPNAVIKMPLLFTAVCLVSHFHELQKKLSLMVDQRTRSLRDLTLRLSQAEEIERDRLAHDVHDSLGQSLTLLKLNLSTAVQEAHAGRGDSARLEQAVDLVTGLIEKSRTLTFDLHPTMLDTLGLVPTLRQYGQQFGQQLGIEVTVNEEGISRLVPSPIVGYLFRAVKELMTNAAKHARPKDLIISVRWLGDGVRIVVDDDGAGFDVHKSLGEKIPLGIGLSGIRERVNSLQGALSVESVIGSGTRVVIDLPNVVEGSKS
jgi:signal transduction histidine kinase